MSDKGAADLNLKPLRLDYGQTIKVGFAFAIIMVFWTAYDYVVPLLLENTFGLSNSMRGLIMGLDNLLSLFLLPLFGRLSDKADNRFSRKFGRRTPFIVVGTLLAVVLMIFVPVSALSQTKRGEEIKNEYVALAYDADSGFLAERLEEFYAAAEGGNTSYCDLSYLKMNDVSKEDYLAIRYDSKLTSKKAVLNFIGAVTYYYDGVEVTLDTVIDGGRTVQEIKDGNSMYSKYVETGLNQWISEQINAQVTTTTEGKTSLAWYMVVLLLVLIAMATFRSPAVALMPDVTPKPLRSQGNAIINLAGGFGSAFAFVIYTVAFFFETAYTYTIIFAAVAAVMLLLLIGFILLVKERKFVEKCEKTCAEYGITDEEPSAPTEPVTEDEEIPQIVCDGESCRIVTHRAETSTVAEPVAEDDEIPQIVCDGECCHIVTHGEETVTAKAEEPPKKRKFINPVAAFKAKPEEERKKFLSFILILASIFMWFMGYNAISSNLSIYVTKALNLSSGVGGIISGLSMGISAIAFIPVGFMAVKLGRKKTIIIGFALAVASFVLLYVPIVRPGLGNSDALVAALFAVFYLIAGFGLIIANVNTFPMVVELASAKDVGKYTGFYYTATMSAQAITPFIAGLIMDSYDMYSLFLYSAVCVVVAIILMVFVRHGDSKQIPGKKLTDEDKKQIMLDAMGDAD